MADRMFSGEMRGAPGRCRVVTAIFEVEAANIAIPETDYEANPNILVSTITHTATGKYTFVLVDPYRRIRYVGAEYVARADNTDLYAQSAPVTRDANGVPSVIVRLKTGANNTDPPATTNGGQLHLFIYFNDSDMGIDA
jgi:hypothetical protein